MMKTDRSKYMTGSSTVRYEVRSASCISVLLMHVLLQRISVREMLGGNFWPSEYPYHHDCGGKIPTRRHLAGLHITCLPSPLSGNLPSHRSTLHPAAPAPSQAALTVYPSFRDDFEIYSIWTARLLGANQGDGYVVTVPALLIQ